MGDKAELPKELTPEEVAAYKQCRTNVIWGACLPFAAIGCVVRHYGGIYLGYPAPGRLKLFITGFVCASGPYLASLVGCADVVERSFPEGSLAKARVYYQEKRAQRVSESTKTFEFPELPELPKVSEAPTRHRGSEPFNTVDLDVHAPEFKGLEELDLNQKQPEQEMNAPIRNHTYDELRQRNRESATHGRVQQQRDIPSRIYSQRSEDPDTSTMETQQKKRVNKYGDIIWDD